MDELSSTVQQNTRLVSAAALAAESLQDHAERLSEVVAIFRMNENVVIEMSEGDMDSHPLSHALDEHIYITER
ncbi:hypothetical protein [uncultured Paenalcaligenes sp.]|uniref:hypothetical protein n=1 Tax=uncultured Paenalcaligenes sp. TaxID=1588925 RepID=UPI00260251E8|nr:hypothetical protein [uncultured Paenalcaligenes sp.]